MENTDKKTGENLRRILFSKGYTLSSFAKKIGVNRSNVQRWCEGTQQIRSENLSKILEALDITSTELLGELDAANLRFHDTFKMAMLIPEDIYRYAVDFEVTDEVWNEVRVAFKSALKQKSKHGKTTPERGHA